MKVHTLLVTHPQAGTVFCKTGKSFEEVRKAWLETIREQEIDDVDMEETWFDQEIDWAPPLNAAEVERLAGLLESAMEGADDAGEEEDAKLLRAIHDKIGKLG